jgi:hypothetical protein
MSNISIKTQSLLPVRRDGQIGFDVTSLSGSSSSGGGGGIFPMSLPIYQDSSIILYYESSTNSIRTALNFYASGEVGAFTTTPSIPNWQVGLFKEASIGTGFYWLNGLLNASIGGGSGTVDVSKGYVDFQIGLRDNSIAWLNTNKIGSSSLNPYATNASTNSAFSLRDTSIAWLNTNKLAYRTFGTAASNNTGDFDSVGAATSAISTHQSTYNHTNYNTAYTHSQNNNQAHSDYIKNDADDTTSGVLTAAGFNTTNFSIVQSGSNLLIKYGATTILTISSAGYITAKDEIKAFG